MRTAVACHSSPQAFVDIHLLLDTIGHRIGYLRLCEVVANQLVHSRELVSGRRLGLQQFREEHRQDCVRFVRWPTQGNTFQMKKEALEYSTLSRGNEVHVENSLPNGRLPGALYFRARTSCPTKNELHSNNLMCSLSFARLPWVHQTNVFARHT